MNISMHLPIAAGLIVSAALIASGSGAATDRASFEGCVDFRIEVETRSPKLPIAVLESAVGHSVTKCFKDGAFKWTYQGGTRLGTTWYKPETNLEYTLEPGAKVILVGEVSSVGKTVTSVVAAPTSNSILGHDLVRILIRYDDESSSEYWVAPDLPVVPLHFSRRKIGGQDILYEKGRGQVLWAEHVSKVMVRREIAVSVNPRPLPDEFFKLPDLPVEPLTER